MPSRRKPPLINAHDPRMSDSFFQRVYEVVRLCPYGRVTSYGAIARYLGTGKSARMVGWAMNVSHYEEPPVPAHRVVNKAGLLSGQHHFAAPGLMQKLLEQEGLEVTESKIQDLDSKFWDPNMELDPLI